MLYRQGKTGCHCFAHANADMAGDRGPAGVNFLFASDKLHG